MPNIGHALLLLMTGWSATASAECPDHGRERYEPRSFMGWVCEADCERHKAGFGWAEQHGVTDPVACEPLGRQEAEGCRSYLEEPLSQEQAGYRWALENEVSDACLCHGAGERFRAGCRRAVAVPAGKTD
jgi:hypothetical protein